MSVTDRRARHRASLRRDILNAASKLFAEEGYEPVTMRRIAATIEYSPTTIYIYFKGKRELVDAICDETFSQLAAKLERLTPADRTPMGYLREGLRTYIDFGLTHQAHYAVTFLQPRKTAADSRLEGSIGARAFDGLRQGVAACAASADIKTTSIDATSQALWASIHGLTALLITDKGFPFVNQQVLIDHLLDVLIAGLRSPSGPTLSLPSQAATQPRPAQSSRPFSFMD